jgi:hypothetical protein
MAPAEDGRAWHPHSVSLRRWLAAAAVLLAALAVVVLGTFRRYGVVSDEPTQHAYGLLLDRFYLTGGADVRCLYSWNWHLYGGLFEAPVAWLAARSPLGVHATRSLCTAAAGLAGIAGCWHAALGIAGPRAAFLAALILALIPGYWGQIFIDSKDVPFAAACAWALSGLVRLARTRRLLWPAVLTGLATGAALGVRVGGVILLACLGLVLAVRAVRERAWPLVRAFLVAAVVAEVVMLSAWPYALAYPVTGPVHALRYFARFNSPFVVVFRGVAESATALPRGYLPLLLGLTLPSPVLLILAAGAAVACGRLARRGWSREPAFLPVAAAASLVLLPVGWAVASRMPMYNGIRHALFVVPPIACLAGVSLDALLARTRPRARAALAAILVAAAGWQVSVTARLFPYEYMSFNALAGGVRGAAGRYDLEYWGASVTEAAARLANEAPAGPRPWRVRICGNPGGADEVLGPRLRIATDHPDYWIAMTSAASGCVLPARSREVLSVCRMGVPLARVLDVRSPASSNAKP